jgi:nitrate/nitrite transporter NarK
MLTFGVLTGLDRMCLPVLFKEISTDLNLSTVSLGAIWGMDPLAGIFVGLPGGLLVDRFGVKRTLTVISILGGIFCALRGFSTNFLTMAASMFLFGAMAAMLPSIVPKAAAVWFERRQMGLTNALINVSGSIGSIAATMTSATILSPSLGGWRNVLFVLGAPMIVIGLLWLFTAREPDKNERQTISTSHVPFREAISRVTHSKEVWILALISMLLWGANTGFGGYFPLYLRNIGWTTTEADSAFTAYNGAFLAGAIPMVLLANRLKAYKGMLFFSLVITMVIFALLPLVNSAGVWVLIIAGNFLRSSTFAVTNILIFDIAGIGNTYGGTAMGMASSIGMIGGFFAPPVGNSLEGFGPGVPFFFWSGMAALALPLFLFLRKPKETKEETKEAIN